jgi:hypothetical protein
VESIEFRSGMFQDYLKNRAHAREEWLKIAQQHRLEQGDHVLIPIQRVDRSNTCPKAMEGRVMSVKEKFVRIGTSAGIIETAFRQDQVQKVTGRKRPLDVPEQPLSFIKAARMETSYGGKPNASCIDSPSLCNCRVTAKGQCKDKKQCNCFRINLKCSSKCHKGAPCDLPK